MAAGSDDHAALRAFFDQPTLQMGVTEMTEDEDMLLVAINVAAASRLGMTPEQAQGRRISELALPGPHRGVWIEQYRQALATRRPVQFEQATQLSGAELWWAVTLAYLGEGPTGRPRFSYILQDISARKRDERTQAALYAISEAAHGAATLPELFARIHAIVGELLPARNLFVALHDAATDTLHFPYFVDEHDRAPDPMPLEGDTLTGRVITRGEALLVTPDTAVAVMPEPEAVIGTPSLDWLGVPLRSQGRTIGALVVQSYAGDVRYDAQDKALLEFVSGQVAAAIARKQADQATQASEHRFRLLFEQNLAGVFRSAPDGRILACNAAFARMLGYDGPEQLHSLNASDLYFEGQDRDGYVAELVEKGEVTSMVMRFKRRDGTEMWGMETVRAIRDEAGEPVVFQGTLVDFTDYKRAEEARTELTIQLAHLAQHDSLTGLPNRLLFQDRLGQALAQARRRGTQVAVLYMDIDRFKQINDTLGHSAGDALLRLVAGRLSSCIRRSDTLARLGGDEFTVVLNELAEPGDAMRVGHTLVEAMRKPFALEGRELYVSVSLGISLFPGDGDDAETLLVNADVAMYRAKEMGRDTFQWFSPEMNVLARERLELEGDLRRALAAGQLDLHYQPQVDGAGRIAGLEALLRWEHPTLGNVAPTRFIPLAEETGLIVPIGQWVLRRACAQAARWRAAGHRWLRVSVNASALQFRRSDWVATVRSALADSGLPAQALELEITESLLLQSVTETTANLLELRDLGVRIAIDDFGTGYSSLSYLHKLPITTLKIDQSFVREIGAGAHGAGEDAPIVRTIVALARNLGMAVVAEGVETEAQRALLLRLGCDALQGYLLHPPLPVAAVDALLAAEVAN
jgi:diguanylate cyclase (GGDEF)-like protein/PAS domain S-box-containing protein